MTILGKYKDSFDTATIPANEYLGFDPNVNNLVCQIIALHQQPISPPYHHKTEPSQLSDELVPILL